MLQSFLTVGQQILTLYLLLVVGFVLGKVKLLDDRASVAPEQPGHVRGVPLYDGGGVSAAAGAYGTAQLRRSDGCLGRTPCGVYRGGHAADPR